MASGPAPAALWVLFRREPVLDAASVAAALGPEAVVEGSDGALDVRFSSRGQGALGVMAMGAPLPKKVVDQCLPVAHLSSDQKDELAGHGAHALIIHRGSRAADLTKAPGVEGLVELYETAWALRGACAVDDDGPTMLGVMNPVTWMCLTTDMLGETVKPEFVDAVRASPAESLALWLGFVKLFKPDGTTWLVTRGGWLVNLPDLAWLAKDLEETDAVFAMFASVLDYVFTSGTRLAAGHTIDLSEKALRVREPYEYVDYIGEGTLVLEAR
jgi:hypothetical protein